MDIHDLSQAKSVLRDLEEVDADIFYELGYEKSSDVFGEDTLDSLKPGFTVQAIEVNADRNYDSYGNSHIDDGLVVWRFTNTLSGETADYGMPIEYASFSGWNYWITELKKVSKKEVIVKTWEWVKE